MSVTSPPGPVSFQVRRVGRGGRRSGRRVTGASRGLGRLYIGVRLGQPRSGRSGCHLLRDWPRGPWPDRLEVSGPELGD
jgi:hypothetical protein